MKKFVNPANVIRQQIPKINFYFNEHKTIKYKKDFFFQNVHLKCLKYENMHQKLESEVSWKQGVRWPFNYPACHDIEQLTPFAENQSIHFWLLQSQFYLPGDQTHAWVGYTGMSLFKHIGFYERTSNDTNDTNQK